ncbi:MAG: PKD domain-containing protein, partial [Promethearchaeota archaeon]
MRNNKKTISLLIIFSLIFQILLMGIILKPEVNDEDSDYIFNFDQIFLALDPNFTRSDYPVIVSNETAEDLWTILSEHHVDNIRIAYYSMENQWELVPFQLDEKAYFRRFTYIQGSQAALSLISITDVDISNWGYYVAEHRYVGKDIDAQPGDPYKEPTKYECEVGFWPTKLAEGWDPRDLTKDPGVPDPEPTLDPREAPGGPWEQHEHRIDYDDELVFYAQNGQKVDTSNWWNAAEYPNRTEIHITDPVDGGQTWMYLYFNDDIGTPAPTTHYFIPPGGEDLVDWDPVNTKVIGKTYELELDPSNKDIISTTSVKLPGYAPIDITTDGDKQWIAINLHIVQSALGTVLFDVQASGDIWREGNWADIIYNEQTTSIGYGITMDLDLVGIESFPGQDDIYDNGHRQTGLGGEPHNGIEDTYKSVLGVVVAAYDDDADHDGRIIGDIAPFLRGVVDHSGATNEAAVDGPCRVILHRTTVQVFGLEMAAPVLYEEFWTIMDETTKFYAGMVDDDPIPIDTDYSNPENPDQVVEAHVHFAFINGQRLTANCRNDPESYIMLGQAPNGDPGLPDLPRCRDEGKTWPLILDPDGIDNDDLQVDNGPVPGHYDDTSLVNPSTGTGVGDGNPAPDWIYVHTSSGGAWTFVPYQGAWELFDGGGGTGNGDFAMYWNDNAEFSELAPYGNDGKTNGKTGPLPRRSVFGIFTEFDCKREYARMIIPLVLTLENQMAPEDMIPVADFVADRTTINEGESVLFTFTGSEGDAPASFSWDFGDLGTSTDQDPTHIYSTAGEYTVTLTVTDSDGDSDIETKVDYIIVSDNTPPVWTIAPISDTIELGDSFYQDVEATDPSLPITYSIDDTTNFAIDSATGVITNAVALAVDTYSLTVTATDGNDNSISASITITVQDTTDPVWTAPPVDAVIELGDSFYQDVEASDLAGVSYSIDDMTNFAIDSATGVITNAVTLAVGTYSLTVTATDGNDNSISATITIAVGDGTDPVWVLPPADAVIELGDSFYQDVEASDLAGVSYSIDDTINFNIDSATGEITNAVA